MKVDIDTPHKVDIHITDRLSGETRVWHDPDENHYFADDYGTPAFHEDGWATFMWSDGSMSYGQNRAMYYAMAGGDEEIPDVGDDRFHVRITDRDTGEELYDDGPDFGG